MFGHNIRKYFQILANWKIYFQKRFYFSRYLNKITIDLNLRNSLQNLYSKFD